MSIRTPLRLGPQVKEVVWGGDWLAKELGRPNEKNAPLGESWEAYSGSVISEGPYAGRTLGDLFTEMGAEVFGAVAMRYPRFPLLVKFIDAHQNLSVQVHPDNKLATRLENYPFGKTEYWYVLEAAPGAEIVYGLASTGVTREQLQQALASQTLLDYCRKAPVKAGDVVFIPAGTVHALTEGVVVYELQQDSDITYRLYDWGRTNREIHLEKGLESIDSARHSMEITHPALAAKDGVERATLATCDLFHSELVRITHPSRLPAAPGSFLLLTAIDGAGALETDNDPSTALLMRKGDTVFLPAGVDYTLTPAAADRPITVIESRIVGV